MKLKLAIIYGFLIWILTLILSETVGPLFIDITPYIDMITPIIIIIVTGFFGILYIRNIETNEVIEGILAGIIFIIVDIVCDVIFLVVPNSPNLIVQHYTTHILSMIVITLLITTLLGYLAQMSIDLK